MTRRRTTSRRGGGPLKAFKRLGPLAKAGVAVGGGLGLYLGARLAMEKWGSGAGSGSGSAAPPAPPGSAADAARGAALTVGMAPQLAKTFADNLMLNGVNYNHAMLKSFQAAAGILVDGLYGPQSATALQKYVPDAPAGLVQYGGTWDGSTQSTATDTSTSGVGCAPSNVVPIRQAATAGVGVAGAPALPDQASTARQILATPDGKDRRILVAIFQRGERLLVNGREDPETTRRILARAAT